MSSPPLHLTGCEFVVSILLPGLSLFSDGLVKETITHINL